MKWTAKKVYDSKIGRMVREVKENNIIQISGIYTASSQGTVASGVIPIGYIGYIYGFGASSSSDVFVSVSVNGNTILPMMVVSGVNSVITSEKPLYVCEPGSSVSITTTGGTTAAWLSIILEPASIEP